jgi:pimeloyl-ACP methyl ester carboxylesterase
MSGCQSLFFWPTSELVDSPSHFDFKKENIQFNSIDNTKLHGWYLESILPESETLGTIYYLHGNGSNLSYHIASMYWLINHGWNIFIIYYRGYGWSEGEPDFKSVINDAAAGYNWLKNNGDKNIIVLGQSLGGAIAVGMLSVYDDIRVSGLILDSTFDSYRHILQEVLGKSWLFWTFQIPMSWGVSKEYDPQDLIVNLFDIPTLLVHSSGDKLISKEHSETLYRKAKGTKSLWISQQPGHVSTWNSDAWKEKLICQLKRWPTLVSAEQACTD